MAKSASYPVISLGLDPSGITKGLNAARNTLKTGMASLSSAVSTPLFGVALANQASEFGQKINRLFLEPFRQLMAQEDLTSRFSVLAGGTDKAGKALDQFKGISRQTGLSLAELSGGLDTLLQGQFSFAGAVAQIEDLSQVASILGEGSLPMLTQAAAKFRSNAFAGFEDLNSLAQSGLPVFDALAERIGVTGDQAKKMAKDGLITGLQAREALNNAANPKEVVQPIRLIEDANNKNIIGGAREALDKALGAPVNVIMEAKANREQTLSGVVSKLRAGLDQTLAEVGNAISRVIDVPTLLTRFRGFVSTVQSLLEQAFGPLKNVIGGDGGNLKRAFMDAQSATVEALKAIGEGFFSFLAGLQKVTNGLIDVLNWARSWSGASQKFNPDQERLIANTQRGMWGGNPLGISGMVAEYFNRNNAIAKLQGNGMLPKNEFGNVDFGIEGLRKKFGDAIAGAAKAIPGNPVADEMARAQARQAEAFAQANGALSSFSETFKSAFSSPFDDAQAQLSRLGSLMRDAVAVGLGRNEVWAMADQSLLGIGKSVLSFIDQTSQQIKDSQFSTVQSLGTAGLVESITKAQAGSGGQADMQTRLVQAMELQRQIAAQNLDLSRQAVNALQSIANKPVAQAIGRI